MAPHMERLPGRPRCAGPSSAPAEPVAAFVGPLGIAMPVREPAPSLRPLLPGPWAHPGPLSLRWHALQTPCEIL